jgi:hypothetical protein
MLPTVPRRKNRYSFTSLKASRTWYHLNSLFSTPVWFPRNLSTAILLCLGLSKGAVTGESGRKMNYQHCHYGDGCSTIPKKKIRTMTIPQQQHNAPTMRNSYFQLGRDPLIWPIAYPSRPPPAIPSPLAVYHNPILSGCCFRVYHI